MIIGRKENTEEMMNKMREIFKGNDIAYFCNCDFYSFEEEFLVKLIKIFSNNETIVEEILNRNLENVYEFEDCIRFLVNKGYLVLDETYEKKIDFGTFLVKEIKEIFKIDIDKIELDKKYEYYIEQINPNKKIKDKTIKFLLTESCIVELLQEKGYGLVNLYSAGDFNSYGVVTLDKIKQLEELFNDLTL